MLRSYIFDNIPIPPEIEEGNIEYKQRLDKKDLFKIKKMASQMLWRLNEGKNMHGTYIAHYYLGINDDGSIANLDEHVIDASINILYDVCNKCNSEITFVDKIITHDTYYIAHVSITKYIMNDKLNDSRVCFLGPYDHGKTTLIAHLTFNQLDDGEGLASSFIHKHIHEKSSGITSSIKNDIIGLNGTNLVNYKDSISGNWEYIINNSNNIISIIDLPGHNKYIKTTISGILNNQPHFAVVVISSNIILDEDLVYLKNMFNVCHYLHIPYFIVFTKCDIIGVSDSVISIIDNMLHPLGKSICEYTKDISEYNDIHIPYISISNIKNCNIKELLSIMNYYSTKYNNYNKSMKHATSLFTIHNNYIIPDKGNILYGIANCGSFIISQKYFLGPISNTFLPITINTIHKKQLNAKNIMEDETASIEINCLDCDISSLNLKECIITNNINNVSIVNSLRINIVSSTAVELDNKSSITFYYKNMCRTVTIIDYHDNIYHIKLNESIYIINNNVDSTIILRNNTNNDLYVANIIK